MPVTSIQSGKQAAIKKSRTSRKRRQDQNVVINELASLVPLSTPLVSCDSSSGSLVLSSGNKPSTISVLRLTSSYIKLQSFLKDNTTESSSHAENKVSSDILVGRMEEAIDGFLIIMDKDANILYVSETIAGHVGLLQQDVIGQNLTDITDPKCSSAIAEGLKPSLVLPTSSLEECVVSQYKQFRIRFNPSVSYSKLPTHSIVQVQGNLKVKLSKNEDDTNLEPVEPSVVGFVGECRVVEAISSILEISTPSFTFTVTKTVDFQNFLSIESTMKEAIGYNPEVLIREKVRFIDFLHPADLLKLLSNRHRLLTGHAITPYVRFLASSGDWVWMQAEAILRYKSTSDTLTPHFWELRVRIMSNCGGQLSTAEQRELLRYASESDEDDLVSRIVKYRKINGAKPRPAFIESVWKNELPEGLSRESGISSCRPGVSCFPKPGPSEFSKFLKQWFTKSKSTSRVASVRGDQPTKSACSSSSTSESLSLESNTTSPSSSSSLSESSPQAQSLGASTQHDPSCSDSKSTDLNRIFKMLLTTKSIPQHFFYQHQQQEGSSNPTGLVEQIDIAQNPPPPTATSSDTDESSSPSSTTKVLTQQDIDPEQFLSFTSNSVSHRGLLSDPCQSDSDSAFSTGLSPPTAFSPEMEILLADSIPSSSELASFQTSTVPPTSVNSDSIPQSTSASFANSNFVPASANTDYILSTSSASFQNPSLFRAPTSAFSIPVSTLGSFTDSTHLSTPINTDSIPSRSFSHSPMLDTTPHTDIFNPQIPSSFNFSSNNSPSCYLSSDFFQSVKGDTPMMLQSQMFDSANTALFESSDPVVQRLCEMTESSDFNSVMNSISDTNPFLSHDPLSQSVFDVQSLPLSLPTDPTPEQFDNNSEQSDFLSHLLLDSQTGSTSNIYSCSSLTGGPTSEIKNIFQQFV